MIWLVPLAFFGWYVLRSHRRSELYRQAAQLRELAALAALRGDAAGAQRLAIHAATLENEAGN